MRGKRKKSVKKIVYAVIVGLALGGNARKAKAQTHEHYFPLSVGNSWTYTNGAEQITFTIVGTEEINGHTYYKFDDYFSIFPPIPNDEVRVTVGREVLFRYDLVADSLLMYVLHGDEKVRYDFTGEKWYDQPLGWCRIRQAVIDCNVPVGEFSDCINFQFGDTGGTPDIDEPDAYQFGEYLSPNVGNIRYVNPGGESTNLSEGQRVTFELQSYTIILEPHCGDRNHPYPVGDLNHDCKVNLLDLLILASHWLEDNTPLNSNSVVKDGIEYYIQADKSAYHLGELVKISYRVTNLTENPVDIGMVLNSYYAYVNLVITQDGNIDIWENCRVIPPSGYIMLILEPHEYKESQQIWNMMNDNGTLSTKDDFPVGPGLYNIMGELRLDGGYERVPVSVDIEIIP